MPAPSKEEVEAVELAIVESMLDADRDFRNSLSPEELRVEPDLSPGHTQAMKLLNHPGWLTIKADKEKLDKFLKLAEHVEQDYFDAFYIMFTGKNPENWTDVEELLNVSFSQDKLSALKQAMTNAIVAGMDAEKDNEGQIILYTGLVQTDNGGYELYEPDL